MIIAIKNFSHCATLARELDDLGVEYRLSYVEAEPELMQGICHPSRIEPDCR